MNMTDTLGLRKQRWLDLYDKNTTPNYVFVVRPLDPLSTRPLPHPDKKQARIEWAWQKYTDQIERLDWLDDDTLPYLDIYTGTEIFAEAFGCTVHRPDDDMPFALPLITEASEVARLPQPDLNTPGLSLLFEIADELRRCAGDKALLRMVDIQSPLDICALIWDKRQFYPALIETPNAVLELAAKVRTLLTAFLDEWFARYGVSFIAHFPDYYMPQGITLSEDEIGAVSIRMFEQLFLPELTFLSERYGEIGMHCCAHARHQWQNFTKIPGLRVLNLIQPPDVLAEAYGFFAPHVVQMHSWCGDMPDQWVKTLPATSRVVIETYAADRDQAQQWADRLRSTLAELRQQPV
jgi:hypothetical protein